MSVAYLGTCQSKKMMKMGLSIFHSGFNSSICKTWAKMTTARIKLLRNKREALVKQMRRDVALLLESGQDATARIRVEHVIREQNIMAANEIIELLCEHIVVRLQIIAKQRDCPPDLKEAISSLIFAASRCSDIPELLSIKGIFQKKYGKDFVSAAADLRPDSGVSRLLIEKLSARNPTGELKLKVMKEIAKEYQVEWDTTETEHELLNPPEQRIETPQSFVSASSLPLNVNTTLTQSVEPKISLTRSSGEDEGGMHFEDAASAARAAAQSAKDAIAAAEAAAQLAEKEARNHPSPLCDNSLKNEKTGGILDTNSSVQHDHGNIGAHSVGRTEEEDDEMSYYYKKHTYNASWRKNSDIKFDESDCDEEIEMEHTSDNKDEDQFHKVHPNLPDYDTLAARFQSLKYQKSHM